MKQRVFQVFVDGSARQSRKDIGWGVVIRDVENQTVETYSGHILAEGGSTTAELVAIMNGLLLVPIGCSVELHTDFLHLVHVGFDGVRGKCVTEYGRHKYIETIRVLAKERHVNLVWVQSHSSHLYNELCHILAGSHTIHSHAKRRTPEKTDLMRRESNRQVFEAANRFITKRVFSKPGLCNVVDNMNDEIPVEFAV